MAAKTLYLYQYNNYYNRTVKGENKTQIYDYTQDDGAVLVGRIQNMTLWSPNDGVDTEITSPIDLYVIPDYAILCNENDVIISRWFVIEAKRIAKTQYRLKLHRDLIVDNYTVIMENENTYINRGWCDASNDAIFNSESMTFNEIKKEQRLLYDVSQCPWIVMYFVPNKVIDGTESNFPDDTALSFTDPINSSQKIIVQYKYRTPGIDDVSDTIIQLSDAPYAMMTIPYATRDYYDGDTKLGTITQRQAMAIAQSTSRKYSSAGWLMDIQLLPYCPCREVIRSDGNIDVSKALAYARTYISPSSSSSLQNKVGGPICCKSSSFIQNLYDDKKNIFYYTVNNIKRDNLTTKLRLVSPNGNGVFEFNPAKLVYLNGQQINFNAFCTYMPYQPYIKIVPNFARMYGGAYKDYRGLVCGGDFSLAQINDSWSAYQIQNKNYQAMFNRQIESVELQNKYGYLSDSIGASVGMLQGGINGAGMGSMINYGAGTLIGGGIGLASSFATGVADVYINNLLRTDKKDAMIDLHNMQLGNIKALPYAVSKVNNFNIDNPYVPYLEVYSCSVSESDNLVKYLRSKSYTINRYGKLRDYINSQETTWLQGTIIKLLDVSDDSHYLAAIADEVNQGFYIERSINAESSSTI